MTGCSYPFAKYVELRIVLLFTLSKKLDQFGFFDADKEYNVWVLYFQVK
jgi:hypothetical protein